MEKQISELSNNLLYLVWYIIHRQYNTVNNLVDGLLKMFICAKWLVIGNNKQHEWHCDSEEYNFD